MKSEFHSVKLSDCHLQLIGNALEVYYRLRSGQIGMAMEEVYKDKALSLEEIDSINSFVRDIVFPSKEKFENLSEFDKKSYPNNKAIKRSPLESGQSFGVGNKEIGDANIAWEVRQTFRQFLAVQDNTGLFNPMFNVFDDPLKVSDEPLPEIVGFNKSKQFYIEDPEVNIEIHKNVLKSLYENAWQCITEYFQDSLPKGESSRICYDDKNGKYYVEVKKPVCVKFKY